MSAKNNLTCYMKRKYTCAITNETNPGKGPLKLSTQH